MGKIRNAKSLETVHTRGILLIVIIITLVIIATGNTVYANFQSRPGTTIYYSGGSDTHFVNTRKMESASGSLGLSATIDANGVETGSNNIDAHMMKQTEFGIVITHINSQYGIGYSNSSYRTLVTFTNNFTTQDSSTLNWTGIMGLKANVSGRCLLIASALTPKNTIWAASVIGSDTVKNRYINIYSTTTQKKSGDAREYFSYTPSFMMAIFGGNSIGNQSSNSNYATYYNSSYAVIVNGTGV